MINLNILIIDDEKELCSSIADVFKGKNINMNFAYNSADGLKKINSERYDLILLDYKLPGMNGFEVIDEINKAGLSDIKIIFMTAYGNLDTGIEAVKRGCFDYLVKPFNMDNLLFRVQRVSDFIELNERVEKISMAGESNADKFITGSQNIKKIFKTVDKIASTDTIVLIEGETGTGKELIARAIHEKSGKKRSLFIPLNCGTLSDALVESELFGYEKGAFTGADDRKYGILETFSKGTVFLDEINSLSLNVQIKLLRFIETGDFLHVGGNKIIKSEARIIAASNQNLEEMIENKTFRQNLYYKLNIVKIVIPSLRMRGNDVNLLLNYFLEKFNKCYNKNVIINKKVRKYFLNYYWPGNVRQLKNLLESLVLLNDSGEIQSEDIPDYIKSGNLLQSPEQTYKSLKNKSIKTFEINFLRNNLKKFKGNVLKVSKFIKLSRTNLIKKLDFYNIDPAEYKNGGSRFKKM